MKPIPFEALHPQEAFFMQWVFSQGWFITHNWHIAIPVKLKRRRSGKYDRVIRWIRSRPDLEV